ncbi:Phosphatidate phosphatase PAH2 [Striga hermonthica]|uniref:Phosphatidate phosphatase PAH2 n=1 Tax=Striga hermonthica TaxID=68872 RepID=A0A9N7N722_STRHE|nr:Phosphatidate phosphatase PAH2 [Striga hermonthica]
MQAVGRLGSYISKSVYSVSGPFHPFGGAVDIIVVEQPDGTYKSSPWYVRFGKFQGVLKTKEKVVSINVNGVEAKFHMYLNHKGEAYFLKEVDGEENDGGIPACSPPSSSGEDMERSMNRRPLETINYNCDPKWSENEKDAVIKMNSRPSQILGLVFGRKPAKGEENESGAVRADSLERAEIAADLLDLKWSTNLDSPRLKKGNNSCNNNNNASRVSTDISRDGVDINLLVDDSRIGENMNEMKCVIEKYVVETITSVENSESEETGFSRSEYHASPANVISEVRRPGTQIQDFVEKGKGDTQFTLVREERVCTSGGSTCTASETIIAEYSESVSIHEANKKVVSQGEEVNACGSPEGLPCKPQSLICDNQEPRISEEEHLVFGNLDDFGLADVRADSSISSRDDDGVNESCNAKCLSLDQSVIDNYIDDVDPQRIGLRSVSSESCIKETGNVHSKAVKRLVRSLPITGPLGDKLEISDERQSPGAQTYGSVAIIQDMKEGHDNPVTGTPPRPIDSSNGTQRTWPFPFKRSKSMKSTRVETNAIENHNLVEVLRNSGNLEGKEDVTKVKERKRTFMRTLTPTSEQLASLSLKEGKNIVVFTFQTAMLGKQQVDARIFLWRWDTRIVISDVDGTITRSDLLGQVMPLVGMDWSQTGVAHLFSAIKENGYQLLFLSARSIAQSFLTRQFLLNIKQDGKALPDGPVVISPDGLFPSLFREVVRRAPHEFKIACLEDIKALFPTDTNPFYAGFGNRDTDEFSYLKVGIPQGKIFIINPKGEIVVNRRVDTKSYVSLHALVHGMFPTMSSSEQQEDFNSWNYWKLPPPMIDS